MKHNNCPRCRSSLRPTMALSGTPSRTWMECSNVFCGTLVDNFEPFGMQYNFLKDPHIYKGCFGGFGSGKSFAVIKDDQKKALITPGGHIAIIGFTYRQINRNFKKDFEEDFPVAFVKKRPGQKIPGFTAGTDMYYELKNGCKIELITSDNTFKLRGLNATHITILEASNVSFEIFQLLKSRLRNDAANIYLIENGKIITKFDEGKGEYVPVVLDSWHSMNLESNPEGNWILTDFLMEADHVQFYGNSYNKYQYKLDDINKDYSLHISTTNINPHLPPNYLEVNTRGKPEHEVKRFYFGSFLFVADMVHPRINEVIVDPYPIDFNAPEIFHIIGYDYGLAHMSAFVFGVVNFKKNLIVFYDELGVNEMTVKEIAEELRKKLSVIPDGKLLFLPKMDAKSFSKRGGDKVSLGSMFEDAGIIFDPIQEDPKTRVIKTNTLVRNGQIQIFRTCTNLTKELKNRKFKRKPNGELTDELIDKNNHFGDAMEFSLIKIPFNLEKMVLLDYIKPGERVIADTKRRKPKPNLTEQQKIIQAFNPFNQKESTEYEEENYEEEEYDQLINKLSGI